MNARLFGLAAAIVGVMGSTGALGQVTPGVCGSDEHIRCAVFDQNETYKVLYRPGNATVVQLEAGEAIDGPASGLGVGDHEAWTVGSKANWAIFKPKAKQAQTNFVIVTAKRRYILDLERARPGETPTWSLTFVYPDTLALLAAKTRGKEVRAQAMLRASASQSAHRNENYEMQGDTILAPTALWDDGRFTYFEFGTSRDIPAIYRKLPDGREAMVNGHMDGDTWVVHDTAAHFVLRLGQSVLGIRNNRYTPDGELNPLGTTVPGEVRLLKNGESDEQ